MTYCSNCGDKISKDDNFCSKCGVKTAKGVENNTPTPSDEMRQAFAKMSTELEKAFSFAAKEIQTAFQTAGDNIQKSMRKVPVVCPSCGEKNASGSVFCFKCGTKLETEDKTKA
ncbi:TPA: zinc-ribbon domain-containing protein [Candidatus Bathyarchaeota archaeon]|nr:zinc-ribbon domain-containing protein [Candidatus Bathyarchaeota archaeon]HIJ08077.1 zinc-ribbon domain-containing protein [Candidatus Bathyarchaeota archaeon]